MTFEKECPITINFLLVQYGIAVKYVGDGLNATWATNGYNNIQTNPIYTTRSGWFGGGSFYYQASNGFLWSGTTNSGTYAYNLYYGSSYVYPAGNSNRQRGFPIRCVAQHLIYNQKFSGNRAFRKIFIMSFLRWDFFSKRSPKARSLARRGRAALTRGDGLSERAPRQSMSANPQKISWHHNQKEKSKFTFNPIFYVSYYQAFPFSYIIFQSILQTHEDF
ncbi:hypothetical protein IJJ36_02160 [Candidatus Saccharibacteria bacterium]|nr:hypothetical protein [Candidatus Saccharibacteria bacterium]